MCKFLPTELDSVCNLAVRLFADPIQEVLDNEDQTSDTICHCLDFCFVSDGYDQVCHIHPIPDYAEKNPNGWFVLDSTFTIFRKMPKLDPKLGSETIG